MYIMVILVLLVPALIGVLFYERFKGVELSWSKRGMLFAIFAFLINFFGYVVLWLRGFERVTWFADEFFAMMFVSFTVQYMGIALVTSIVLAYVLSLVRIDKSRADKTEESELIEEAEKEAE